MLSQILGGFVAALAVYGIYKQQLDAVSAGFEQLGIGAEIFGPSGVRINASSPPLGRELTDPAVTACRCPRPLPPADSGA